MFVLLGPKKVILKGSGMANCVAFSEKCTYRIFEAFIGGNYPKEGSRMEGGSGWAEFRQRSLGLASSGDDLLDRSVFKPYL